MAPDRIARVFSSPRKRALQTLACLSGEEDGREEGVGKESEPEITEELAEWDYGIYEGLLTAEIKRGRRERGLDVRGGREWDIWRDGCEGGECVLLFFFFFCYTKRKGCRGGAD